MPYTILLVDDDDVFRKEFKQCLDDFDVVEAPDGEAALKILKRPNEIDLVILDVKMPGESGTGILRKMKEVAPGLSIIILTGHSSEDIAVEALKGRADDYVEKPCNPRRMKEMIERLLAGKRRESGSGSDDIGDKIARVKEYLERNCFKRVTLGDVSRAVSLSPKYLSRIFKEVTGRGFSEYRLGIQIEKAKALLDKGGYNVSGISDKLGYLNPESFIRQFKKFTGCTPTGYRKRQKAGRG